MPESPAPAPWDFMILSASHGSGHVYLLDRNGRKIGVVWGPAREKLATAALLAVASDLLRIASAADPAAVAALFAAPALAAAS
jgi:hypothetical protein